jgi:DNA-binding transcriptional LysR family regulator
MAVTVRHLSTGEQTSALRDGEIDVAFGYLPSEETGELVSELLRDDPIIGVLLPAAHLLASKDPLWLRDLASLPFLGLSRELNPVTYDSVMRDLAERGLTPDPANIEAVGVPAVSLVAEGCCWKLASQSMIEEADTEPGVVFRRFSDPPMAFGLWLRRSRLHSSPVGQQFAAICTKAGSLDLRYSLAALWPVGGLAEIWSLLQSPMLFA